MLVSLAFFAGCVTLLLHVLTSYWEWSQFTSPASYPSGSKVWDRDGMHTTLIMQHIVGRLLSSSLTCGGLHSNPTCNMRRQQGAAVKPRKAVRNRVFRREGVNVTIAFTKECSKRLEDQVLALAQGIVFLPSSASIPTPPKPDWPPETEQSFFHLLRELVDIMGDLNIDHFVSYGALIGISRHGGLIPWDEKDIDIVMIDADGTQKKKLLGVLSDGGFLLDCFMKGVLISVYRREVNSCSGPGRFPKIDIWTTFTMPSNPSMYWLHAHPSMFTIPANLVHPLRLAYIGEMDDSELAVSFRPASDGVLDCSGEYMSESVVDGGLVQSSWRSICHDGKRKSNCSDRVAELSFVSSAQLSLSDFAHRYTSDAEAVLGSGPLDPETTIHASWRHYQGGVVHFWLDFAVAYSSPRDEAESRTTCSVLLSAPRSEPKVAEGKQMIASQFGWEKPQMQCYVL